MRRREGLVYFSSMFLNNGPIKFFFGDGPGKLVESRFSIETGAMRKVYGIRYGGRMGFVWLLTQVGYGGALIYLYFFVSSFFCVKRNFKAHPLYLGFLVLILVFFLDTIVYSSTFIICEYAKGLIFFIFALLYKDIKSKGLFLKKIAI